MFVAIHHNIKDTQKWDQAVKTLMAAMEQGSLPQGVKPLMYLPAKDGRRADCVWEAESAEALKAFLEPATSIAAQNEYIPLNAQAAIGLPAQEPATATA